MVTGDVADSPLAKFSTAEAEQVAAWFMCEVLKASVNLVVGAEGRVGRVFSG